MHKRAFCFSAATILLVVLFSQGVLMSAKNSQVALASEITPKWTFNGAGLSEVAISPDERYIGAERTPGSSGYEGNGTFYLFSKDSNVPLWSYNATENSMGLSRGPDIHFTSDGDFVSITVSEYIGGGNYLSRTLLFQCNLGPVPVSSYPGWGFISGDGQHVETMNWSAGYLDRTLCFFATGNMTPEWTYP